MPGIARLKRRAEFLRVAGGRRKAVTPGLILQALERPREDAAMLNADTNDAPRVGFTASRKVGIAVARNRARRRLKAAAAQVMPRRNDPLDPEGFGVDRNVHVVPSDVSASVLSTPEVSR